MSPTRHGGEREQTGSVVPEGTAGCPPTGKGPPTAGTQETLTKRQGGKAALWSSQPSFRLIERVRVSVCTCPCACVRVCRSKKDHGRAS